MHLQLSGGERGMRGGHKNLPGKA